MATKKSSPKKLPGKTKEPATRNKPTESTPVSVSAPPIDLDLIEAFAIEDPNISTTDLLIFKEYFSNGMNGTRAWMATHPDSQYDSASVSFLKWLRNARISPIMEKVRSGLAMDVFEAVARMGAIARGDIRHFLVKGADGFMYIDISNPEAQAHMHLVEQIETKRERRIVGYGEQAEEFEGEWVKVKLHSAPAAQRDILKMHGKFINRTEITGKDGEPLVPPVDHEGYNESLDALADAVGEILSRKNSEAGS